MPYPAKLTAEKILGAALGLLETGGPDALGMRPLADALGVRPSSLYRYYPERDALLGAMEAHAAHDLHAVIQGATREPTPCRRPHRSGARVSRVRPRSPAPLRASAPS